MQSAGFLLPFASSISKKCLKKLFSEKTIRISVYLVNLIKVDSGI